MQPSPEFSLGSKCGLLPLFLETRAKTQAICSLLTAEDHVLQTMEDVSPPKWHLGHTTWFFEEFLLKKCIPDFSPFHPRFNFLFNSYYESMGERLPRKNRGFLSRPSLAEVQSYREAVDSRVSELFQEVSLEKVQNREALERLLLLGIQHEKQHQELLLTDIKYNFYQNPLCPSYHSFPITNCQTEPVPLKFLEISSGLYSIGQNGKIDGELDGKTEFCYDNEMPRHDVYCHDFCIANRLITCGEFLDFIEDGGYQDFRHWLSDGWEWVQKEKSKAPLYWQKTSGEWYVYRLSGLAPLLKEEPVCHINYYEALAYAHWVGKRLPTEAEWETAALQLSSASALGTPPHFADSGIYHPSPAKKNQEDSAPFLQCLGELWEWTSSAYQPYPGYRPFKEALGEYNKKFMCSQMVLRGGSCVSPQNHIRISYRNFLYVSKCWQFSGLRLAQDA